MTSHNPFAPPEARIEDVAAATAVGGKARRPISAWILMLVLVLTTVSFVIGTATWFWLISTSQTGNFTLLQTTFAIGWRVVAAAAGAFTIVGIFRRKPWSRWTGLVAIVLVAGAMVLRSDNTVYPNDAQAAGAWFGHFVAMPALCVWWAYAFAFSRKAVRYFYGSSTNDD